MAIPPFFGMSRGRFPRPGAAFAAERFLNRVNIDVTNAAIGEEMFRLNSPCATCTRVRDPQNCENKTCKDWQAWFLDRWETMRENVRKDIQNAPVTEAGIPLGGHFYAHPHRVQAYLQEKPCIRCQCPRALCQEACQARKIWNDRQKEEHK